MSAKDSGNQITEAELHTLLQEADESSRAGMIGDAGRQYSHILALLEGSSRPRPAETAYCLQRIGDLCWFSGRYIQAEKAYAKLLVIAEINLGVDHPELDEIRGRLAQIQSMNPTEGPDPVRDRPSDAGLKPDEFTSTTPPDGPGHENEPDGELFEPEPTVPPFQRSSPRQVAKPVSTSRSKVPLAVLVFITVSTALLVINAAACLTFVGNLFSDSANYTAALYTFNLAHRVKPGSVDIMYKLACTNVKLNHLHRAVDDFSFVIANRPNYADAYFGRGVARSELRDYENAIKDFDQLITLQPDNAISYVRRGIAQAKSGHYDRAIKDYDEATRLDPTNAEAIYNRGWALELQYDEAMENGPASIAMVPAARKPDVVAQKLPVPPSADKKLDQLNEVIKTAPTAEHYCERGWTWLTLNKLMQAMADFDAAIKLNDKFARAYLDRGLAYYKLNQLKPAIEDYSRSIAIDDQNASAYYRRAVALHKQGQYTKAAKDYQQAGRLNPTQAKQYEALAQADLNRLEKYVEAPETKNSEQTAKQPAASVKEPSASANQPLASGKPPPASGKEPGASGNQSELSGKQPVASVKQPVAAAPSVVTGKDEVIPSAAIVRSNSASAPVSAAPASAPAAAQPEQQPSAGGPNQEAHRHHVQASLLSKETKFQEALNECLAAIACKPSPPLLASIYRDTGALYERLGNHDLAWEYLGKSLSIAPDNAPSLGYRGLLWLQRGDTEKALADANAAIAINPNILNAHIVKWRAYQKLGKSDLAKAEQQWLQEHHLPSAMEPPKKAGP